MPMSHPFTFPNFFFQIFILQLGEGDFDRRYEKRRNRKIRMGSSE